MPTESVRDDEELMSRREHNRIVQTILASRGASVPTGRPEDESQTASLVSEESVVLVDSDGDSQLGEGTGLHWQRITNNLLDAWELENRKLAVQGLRSYWSRLGRHLRANPWVRSYREKYYVAVYRQATVKRWVFRQ